MTPSRICGDDIPTLRNAGERLKELLRAQPTTERVQDNWGAEIFRARLSVDPDKAALAVATFITLLMRIQGTSYNYALAWQE